MHKACWKKPLSTHSGKIKTIKARAQTKKKVHHEDFWSFHWTLCVWICNSVNIIMLQSKKLNLKQLQNKVFIPTVKTLNYWSIICCEHVYSVQAINIWYSWHWSCWLSTTLWTKPTKLAKIFHPEWKMISHEAILSTINCKCCPLSHQLHRTRMDF